MSDFNIRVAQMVCDIQDRQKSYIQEAIEWSNKGYRPKYCFHGIGQWVDYDIPCGMCEDGEINEYSEFSDLVKYARNEVKAEMEEERIESASDESVRDKYTRIHMSNSGLDYNDARVIVDRILGNT